MSSDEAVRTARVLFVTIGTSPRPGLVAELSERLPPGIGASEIGLLDGLSLAEIDAMAASDEETSLIAYMGDQEIVISRHQLTRIAASKIEALPPDAYDLVVLLSTGILRDFESRCPTVNGQRAIEAAIISIASQGDRIGLVVPLERQREELDIPALALFSSEIAHAGHGDEAGVRRAAAELENCDYIVLCSIGYDDADQRLMAGLTGKPVMLGRQVILSSTQLVLGAAATQSETALPPELQRRLDQLTPRERQVMPMVCEGLSNKAIARQLDISYKTVEVHRSSILRKMAVPSSGALIRLVIGAGIT